MSATTTSPTVDLERRRTATRAGLALVLALLAVPGVVFTWDVVDGGGFVTGVPLAIIAIVLGIRSRPSGKATAAIVIGSVCLLFVAACTAFFA